MRDRLGYPCRRRRSWRAVFPGALRCRRFSSAEYRQPRDRACRHLAKNVSSYLALSSKIRLHEALGRKRPFVVHRADPHLERS